MPYWCYVAGPYTLGDPEKNTYIALDAADDVLERFWPDMMPIVPHLSHWWNGRTKYSYDFWIDYTLEQARRCDVILRLPGLSKGADGEVELFREKGKPVVYSMHELGAWLRAKMYSRSGKLPLRGNTAKIVGQPDDALSGNDESASSNGCCGDICQDGNGCVVNSAHETPSVVVG